MDIYNEIQQKNEELRNAVASLSQTGRNYAEAYKKYRILLAQELIRLKNDGMPVTIIQLVAYGLPTIATLRYKRDGNEAMYKIALEDIAVRKLELRLLESQVQREYGHKENI